MKDKFTVKEIMDGTGLTRQRIHQIIKSHNIPVDTDQYRFSISWDDLLKLADNDTMLNFLRSTLQKEKQEIGDSYEDLKDRMIRILYLNIIMMEAQFPTPEGVNEEWRSLLQKANDYYQLTKKICPDSSFKNADGSYSDLLKVEDWLSSANPFQKIEAGIASADQYSGKKGGKSEKKQVET